MNGTSVGLVRTGILAFLLMLIPAAASATVDTWAAASSMTTAREFHTSTLLPSGRVLVVGGQGVSGVLANAELYDPNSNTWSAAGSLTTARWGHSATLLPSGKVLVVGGTTFNGAKYVSTATAELYDPATNSWSAAGSLATSRIFHTATLLPSAQLLVAGGYVYAGSGDTAIPTAELYDSASNTWSSVGSLATARGNHAAALLPSGKVLVAGGDSDGIHIFSSAEIYDPATKTWSAAGAMTTAREVPTSILLASGRVLVVGGSNGGTELASAELYDPNTNTWSTTGSLTTERYSHALVLLPSGKVLVAGGSNPNALDTVELYDPAAGSWMAAGSLTTDREHHTATLLPSGRVLIVGGDNGTTGPLNSTELYDPAESVVSPADSLANARYGHTATLLTSGKLMVAGGYFNSTTLASTELYEPVSNTWSDAGSMANTRGYHTATILPSGKVLVAGGYGEVPGNYLASAELYDSVTDTWSGAGSMATARVYHTATLLPSGKVLVAGGWNGVSPFSSAELYDPVTNIWSPAGSLANARYAHTATLLPSGKVLVAGGNDGTAISSYLASTELYDPVTNTWVPSGSLAVAREGHSATLLPSGKVLVAGGHNATNGWLAAAEVYDPVAATWSTAGSMTIVRENHTASLLPSGEVLVVAGFNSTGISYNPTYLASTEVYDPVANTWSAAGTLATARTYHTATLLSSGKVLVAGGNDAGVNLASAELIDPGLAPVLERAPNLTSANAFLSPTSALTAIAIGSSYTFTGAVAATGFMPSSEASDGATNNSASNAPVFQVQRIDNEQMSFVANDEMVNMSDKSFTGHKAAFASWPAGPLLVRVWVNGVPSSACLVEMLGGDSIFADGFESAACP
jgi:N-acetylneuraminic acid mutarotase